MDEGKNNKSSQVKLKMMMMKEKENHHVLTARGGKSTQTCELGSQKIMGLLWSHRKFWSNTTRSQLDMSFNIILLVKVQ